MSCKVHILVSDITDKTENSNNVSIQLKTNYDFISMLKT